MSEPTDRQEWSAAFQRATWGCAPAIGRALGLSPRAVQQWGQAESDKRSPGERLEILMRVADATAYTEAARHTGNEPATLDIGVATITLTPDQLGS